MVASAASEIVSGKITPTDAIIAGCVLLAGLIAGAFLQRGMRRLLLRSSHQDRAGVDATAANLVARLSQLTIVTFALLYALMLLGVQVGPLFAALGIGGIAIAFALRDTLENLIAGLVLQLRRPFVIGDRVLIGTSEGRVVDIGFRYVQIARTDGTLALHPARRVLDDVVVNTSTESARRVQTTVSLPCSSDPKTARELVMEALFSMDILLQDPAPEAMLSGMLNGEVTILVRMWFDPKKHDAVGVIDDLIARLQPPQG